MRHFYYSENDEQLGPFTYEELKPKRLKKSTLVWTDGLTEWTVANEVEELKSILVSEPPPLPKKGPTKPIDTITITPVSPAVINSKYDLTYEKETDATLVGVLIFIVPIVIQFAGLGKFEDRESYEQAKMWFGFGLLGLRICVTIWIVNIAKRQNRNSTGWGWFAFFLPGISLIIIGQLKKRRLKIEIDGSLSINQQVAVLMEKARAFYSDDRHSECIEILNNAIHLDNQNRDALMLRSKVFIDKARSLYYRNKYLECIQVLNKVIEFDRKNYDALLLRGKSLYNIEKYDGAQEDFEILKTAEQFPKTVYYYLGMIESKKYNYAEAVELWKIAKTNGNGTVWMLLDRYCNYKGKYLLKEFEVSNKLGIQTNPNFIDFGDAQYLGGVLEINEGAKFKTKITHNEFGIIIKLSKLFKSYYIGISYFEMDDIVYSSIENNLAFHLFDKSVISFRYNASQDNSKELEYICNSYEEETGKGVSAKLALK